MARSPPPPPHRAIETVAAQLERRRRVHGPVQRPGEEPARKGGAAHRSGPGPAQRRRLAQPRRVGGGERDHPRDQGRCEGRAPGERAQRLQHEVGVHAGRVDRERDHHHRRPEPDHRPRGERLGGDVDLAQQRPVAEAGENGVAAVGDQPVDHRHQQRQGETKPRRQPDRAGGARQDAGDRGREPGGGEHQRARVEEGDHHKGAEIGDRGPRSRSLQDAGTRGVGKRRPHRSGSGIVVPCAVATA